MTVQDWCLVMTWMLLVLVLVQCAQTRVPGLLLLAVTTYYQPTGNISLHSLDSVDSVDSVDSARIILDQDNYNWLSTGRAL